ncbi:hypothetical protein D3C77_653660 [compost metagenome]
MATGEQAIGKLGDLYGVIGRNEATAITSGTGSRSEFDSLISATVTIKPSFQAAGWAVV